MEIGVYSDERAQGFGAGGGVFVNHGGVEPSVVNLFLALLLSVNFFQALF